MAVHNIPHYLDFCTHIYQWFIDWIERTLVADEGVEIKGVPSGKSLEQCKTWCDETNGCNSIAWAVNGGCYLKKKCLTESDPSKSIYEYKSYYKPCQGMCTLNNGISISIKYLQCYIASIILMTRFILLGKETTTTTTTSIVSTTGGNKFVYYDQWEEIYI